VYAQNLYPTYSEKTKSDTSLDKAQPFIVLAISMFPLFPGLMLEYIKENKEYEINMLSSSMGVKAKSILVTFLIVETVFVLFGDLIVFIVMKAVFI
jgi:hypothetical protein